MAAAISRFASTIDDLLRGFLLDPEFEAIVERDVREGQHRNPTEWPEWFTTAYFHLPEELRGEVKEARFAVEALVGIEGSPWPYMILMPGSKTRGGARSSSLQSSAWRPNPAWSARALTCSWSVAGPDHDLQGFLCARQDSNLRPSDR